MTNINPFQFINNYMNPYQNGGGGRVANNSGLNGNMPQQSGAENSLLANMLPQTMQQISRTSSELAMLNEQQTVNMLKQLLNFPQNIEQFLNQITANNEKITQQTFLMLLASTIDINKISTMIRMNSKEAMTNLYQMLAQFNQIGISLKDEQVSELTKFISFIAASATSDVQTLKTVMLMYLPWLPLTDNTSLKLEIDDSSSENAKSSNDYISVLISTENYGNIQADIYKTNEDGIKILMITSETFPQENLKELMKEESKKYSININMEIAVKKAFNKEMKDKPETQISMNTSPGVNPFLLLISNTLIKNIHTIDNKEKIREQRKEKINNGENKN